MELLDGYCSFNEYDEAVMMLISLLEPLSINYFCLQMIIKT